MQVRLEIQHLPESFQNVLMQAENSLDVHAHTLLFFCSLLLSFPLGWFQISAIRSSTSKHLYSAFAGLALGFIVYGESFLHCVALPILAHLLDKLVPSSLAPLVVSAFSLTYLSCW